MKDHHPILKSQIREHIGTAASSVESLRPFLSSINDIYWRLHPHLSHLHPPLSERFLSHVQYQNIFESSSTALTILSDDAVILLANREFEEMSGYKKADLEGKKSLAEFFSPRDFEHFLGLPKNRKPAVQKLAHRAETKLADKNGRIHYVLLSLSAIQGAHQYIASFIDISERKHAEEEILKQRAELSRMNDRLRSLHELSAVITRTLDLKALLTDALHTVTRMELLHLESKGMIFIMQGTHLHLSAHIGLSDSIVALHSRIDPEIALCCTTEQNSSTVFTCDSPHLDCAFAAQNPENRMQPHIIIPLRSHNATTGMMCLFPRTHTRIDTETREMLETIANQIGITVENALLYEKTKSLSLHDHLTGLPNRRFLQLEIERNFAKSKRYATGLSLLMLDIDNFKQFNDTNGHTAGDALLADIARVILREIRETDLAVRYGGEEFLILLPETNFQQAFEIADRMRQAVAERTMVTISVGMSSFSESMESHTDMINDADRALYLAKANGKNRVEGLQRQMQLPLKD